MRVADYICQALKGAGVEHVFVVTGGGAMFLNDALAQSDLAAVCTHHEQAGAIAAEGYARARGGLGAVMVTTGPGSTNTITGLIGAYLDSVPVFFVSGQVKRETCLSSHDDERLRQLGDQEVDIVRMVGGVTKAAVHLRDPMRARCEVERLLHLAQTGRKGPVWLDIPVDVQSVEIDPLLLEGYVPPDSSDFAAPGAIEEVARWIREAKRPLIVAGQGVRLAGAVADLLSLLGEESLPCASTLLGFDIVPFDHKSHVGRIGTIGDRSGNFALQNADLVIFIGTRNNIRQVGYNYKTFARSARKVVVDIDPAELDKPTLKPDLGLCLDAGVFLRGLSAALRDLAAERRSEQAEWLPFCRERREKYPTVLPEYLEARSPVNPYYFAREISRAAPDDAVFVTANATACITLFQAGEIRKGQRVIWNSGAASMGYGLPAALGAAIGTGRPVIAIVGDGSLMMNVQELQTLSHLKANVHVFVLNNDGYISMRQTQENFFNGRFIGADKNSGVSFPRMEDLARTFSMPFARVESQVNLPDELGGVLAKRGPLLCEVVLPRDYRFSPKASSERKADGRIVSKPLEDMAPFLPREEFLSNLLVPPLSED